MQSLRHRPVRRAARGLAACAAAFALALPAGAAAQFATPADSTCIQAVNAGVRKVGLAATKQLRACAGYAADGLLGPQSVGDCATVLVQGAVVKARLAAERKCGGVPPSFGPPSITAPPDLTVAAGAAVLEDVFGASAGAFVSVPNVRTCQDTVLKAMRGCVDARLSAFNRCKKEGLKRGFVRTAAELQDTCLGTGGEQPDPTGGTIAKRCTTYTAAAVQSKCVARAVALDMAMPGCGVADASAFGACFGARVRCRVCGLLNAADGLARDCDLFDDGDDGNASCG